MEELERVNPTESMNSPRRPNDQEYNQRNFLYFSGSDQIQCEEIFVSL